MQGFRFFAVLVLVIVLAISIFAPAAQAQVREAPYWATLRWEEVNMRVGPSAEYRIDWVYKRKGLPVRVVRLREGWRLIQDHEGTQGWVASSQLAATRGAIIVGEGLVELREKPRATSPMRWRAEAGVVGALLGCEDGFCEIDVRGRTGWVSAGRLWGVDNLASAD
ncbi:SH3 domain-containing protein [Erythrobacter sp.]|jgi:SH3-like domain-containing protein|uniref:SH3 domain-containing protein n=1 Tax=Erythrobacter sp. TaxID=1042 RepID=UPI002EA279C5|nr:SH3 domain-containing protein [Erythrobacter sp.]